MDIEREICPRCGRKWHPPGLCWAYDWLDEEVIESVAAGIINFLFDKPDIDTWENEGGRVG